MPVQSKNQRANLIAALSAVIVAVLLTLLKFVLATLTDSIAVLTSAVDSLLDVTITTMILVTIRAAARPPDANHSYGHGKFEAFAELLQGMFIVGSGSYLAYMSLRRFFFPTELSYEYLGVVVMIFSMLASSLLVYYLKHVERKTCSIVLKAEIANFSSDILANFAVIGGLLAVKFFGVLFLDPLISLIIAGIIIVSAGKLLVQSFEVLTDAEMPQSFRKNIIEIIETTDQQKITGWHQLRARRAGTNVHIDYHLVFTPGISLLEAHACSDRIEQKILKLYPQTEILVHFDPYYDEPIQQEKTS